MPSWALALMLASCFLLACERPSSESASGIPNSDDALASLPKTVPLELWLGVTSTELRVAAGCSPEVQEILRNAEADDEYVRLLAISRGHETKCRVLAEAARLSREAADSIEAAGKMPEKVFVASIFEPNGAGFDEQELGPFLAIEDCSRVEAMAREADLPTRRCRAWQPLPLPDSDERLAQ